jgi:hypothetical protein
MGGSADRKDRKAALKRDKKRAKAEVKATKR